MIREILGNRGRGEERGGERERERERDREREELGKLYNTPFVL